LKADGYNRYMGQPRYIVDISHALHLDPEYIGKKALELAELRTLGVLIPDGFVITTSFFTKFLEATRICNDIKATRELFHPSLSDSAEKFFQPIKEKIMQTDIPHDLISEFHRNYRLLTGEFNTLPVDIFSSCQTDNSIRYEGISGDANTLIKIKTIWASNFQIPVAVVIAKNIKTEIKGKVITENPDIDQNLPSEQANDLRKFCHIIQKHFYFPKEIEYAVNGKIIITKINPFTGETKAFPASKPPVEVAKKILLKGVSVNQGIATGPAKVLNKPSIDMVVRKDEILIIPRFENYLYNYIKKAKAVVVDSVLTNPADLAFYKKIVRIPTVEGVKNADKIIKNGNVITVNGVTGEVYPGAFM
jgi:phosphoenolpyruvate synthase/pyruvate phosphate dikinase